MLLGFFVFSLVAIGEEKCSNEKMDWVNLIYAKRRETHVDSK